MNYRTLVIRIVVSCLCSQLMISCALKMDMGKSDDKRIGGGGLNAQAYYSRGNEHIDAGRYPKAIADYTKAVALDTTHAGAFYSRGFARNKMGRYDEKAIADYTKAIELIPSYGDAYRRSMKWRS